MNKPPVTIQTDPAGDEVPWPTGEGYWMAWLHGSWFPLAVRPLHDDLPTKQQIDDRDIRGIEIPKIVLGYVAQMPIDEVNWPFVFEGNHVAKRWRRPTPAEAARVVHFYGLPADTIIS